MALRALLVQQHKKLFPKAGVAIKKLAEEDEVFKGSLRISERLLDDVMLHFKVEDETIYRMLKAALKAEEAKALQEFLGEHKELEEKMTVLLGIMKFFEPRLAGKLTKTARNFSEVLMDHAKDEDDGLFLLASRVLSEDQLREIDEMAAEILSKAGREDLTAQIKKAAYESIRELPSFEKRRI